MVLNNYSDGEGCYKTLATWCVEDPFKYSEGYDKSKKFPIYSLLLYNFFVLNFLVESNWYLDSSNWYLDKFEVSKWIVK